VLENTPYEWVNSEVRPIIYLYNLKLWNIFSSSSLGRFIDVLENVSISGLSMLILLALGFFIFLVNLRFRVWGDWKTGMSMWGIFVFGFSGMSLEIILLYDFQIIYGFLYSEIGLLVALFMLGLTCGAWMNKRWIEKEEIDTKRMTFAIVPILELLLVVGVGFSFGQYIPEWVISFEIFLAGFLTGSFFPLACEVYSSAKKEKTLKTSSRVDAFDHFGALLGAMLMGIVVMPVVGVWGAVGFIIVMVLSLPASMIFFHRIDI